MVAQLSRERDHAQALEDELLSAQHNVQQLLGRIDGEQAQRNIAERHNEDLGHQVDLLSAQVVRAQHAAEPAPAGAPPHPAAAGGD